MFYLTFLRKKNFKFFGGRLSLPPKSYQVQGIFFRIGGPQSEQVSINGIPEETIAYDYKEVGINNLKELRCAKVQLGLLLYQVFTFHPKKSENYHDKFPKIFPNLIQRIYLPLSWACSICRLLRKRRLLYRYSMVASIEGYK